MKKVANAEEYILKNSHWAGILDALRNVAISCKLKEEIKWGGPVYSVNGKNIVGIGAFKNFCALWFFQGALLKDKQKKLVNAQEGVTKALRQWRFSSVAEVDKKILKDYIEEAITNAKQGREIKPVKNKELILPELLQKAFGIDYELKDAFGTFSLSKKREFAEYISSAKQENTKISRMEKIKPLIKAGIGLNDKYRK